MCGLLEALDYEQEDVVIDAFTNRYSVTRSEAEEIFCETKKWLWLAANLRESPSERLFIDKPLAIIDEMWHNFILHTKMYYEYCMEKFKFIVHHSPTSHEEKATLEYKLATDPGAVFEEDEIQKKKQYSLIYEHLGAETLLTWYEKFPKRYTEDYIRKIRKY